MIVGATAMASVTSVKAGNVPDLAQFGTPVDTTMPAVPAPPTIQPTNKYWPAHVCAEIQRVEKVVISGLRPTDQGMSRLGLLMLERRHCGIDVSKKLAADQAALEDALRKADRDYEESMAAAQRAASSSQEEPVIVQVPQAAPEPAAPAPPRTLNCFTSRFGGGISTTTCR